MDEQDGRFRSFVSVVGESAVYAIGPASLLPATAPTVVLVHGLGLSHRYMMPVARSLSDTGCRVFVPDLPGFGSSGHPPEVLDVPGLADALAGWMESMGLPSTALLGNSFGCQIIADLAARYPERVDRAVLQGPTTPPGERTWVQQFIRWRQNAPYNPPELGPISYADYRRCGYRRLWRTFRFGLWDRMEDKLPHIRAETLVVRGQRDPICSLAWTVEVAKRLPKGRLAEIPGVAHTLCYTAPEQLARVTKTFLED